MKNLSRAYNRHKQHTKFMNRVEKWFASHWGNDADEKQKALSGEGYTFLRTTSSPCNCYGCSGYYKYKRTPKHKVIRDALNE